MKSKANRRRRAISMIPKIETSSVDVDSDLGDRASPAKRARLESQLRDVEDDTSDSDSEDIELASNTDVCYQSS